MIVPQLGCKLMAGYAYKFSPYRNGVEAVNSNRQYLSGGISFLVDKQVKIDAAYQHGWWKQSTTDDLLGTDENGVYFATREKLQSNRLLVSLSYRF
jgi:long-subunit fatty acid transport protein